MFSRDITGSDAFRDMPSSSQLLYFHLGMEADDDGFLGAYKTIQRATGASDDDFKILIAKRFLIQFESGVIVVKHWLINNTIRKDRYNETKYLEEKRSLYLKDNMSYSESESSGIPLRNQFGIPKLATQNRIEENRIVAQAVAPAPAPIEEVYEAPEREERPQKKESWANARKAMKWFPEVDPAWGINSTELKAADLLFAKGEETVRKNIKYCLPRLEDPEFSIHNLTPYLLITNWKRIYDYSKRG